jgi:hypothetical protein
LGTGVHASGGQRSPAGTAVHASGAQRPPLGTGVDASRAQRSPANRTANRETAYLTAGSAAIQPDIHTIDVGARPSGARLGVAPPAPVTTPRAPFVALVLFLVVSGVLGILVLNTKINENAFRLKDLRDRQSRLDLQEQQLNDDLALAASPNSLAAAARRLGLVPAGSPAFIRLPDGRVLGVPQPATAQQSLSGPQAAAAGR